MIASTGFLALPAEANLFNGGVVADCVDQLDDLSQHRAAPRSDSHGP